MGNSTDEEHFNNFYLEYIADEVSGEESEEEDSEEEEE